MRNLILCVGIVALASQAAAQTDRFIGVGGRATGGTGIDPRPGVSVVFDLGSVYIESDAFFLVGDITERLVLGGGAYYVLHQTSSADFGLGGNVNIVFADPTPGDATLGVSFNAGAQIRAFLVDNVAFQASLGFTVLVVDSNAAFGMLGNAVGTAGVIYYF